jgi:hypothetical protein
LTLLSVFFFYLWVLTWISQILIFYSKRYDVYNFSDNMYVRRKEYLQFKTQQIILLLHDIDSTCFVGYLMFLEDHRPNFWWKMVCTFSLLYSRIMDKKIICRVYVHYNFDQVWKKIYFSCYDMYQWYNVYIRSKLEKEKESQACLVSKCIKWSVLRENIKRSMSDKKT